MSKVSTIGKACNITTGKLDANCAVNGGQYPFFTCSALPAAINNYAFDDDVILIAGNNAQGNFHVSRYKGKFNAYQRTYVLTAKPGYSLDYIYYSLKLELKRLKEHSQGSQTKFLTMPILTNIVLRNLDYDDQQQIAAVLSSIDQKIEINNRINAELEAMAKTLYDYWFVQFDFPFDFAQGAPDENVKPYKSSGGKMVYSKELKREIPAGWEAGTLFDLGEIVGGSTPSRENSENFTTSGTAWITPKDLSNNKRNIFISKGETDITNDGIKNASLKILPKHTILLSSRAPIGYMAIATNELTTNQGFKSFIPNKDYPFSFIFHTVQSKLKIIEQYASGSTFKEISASTLKTVAIPLPSIYLVNVFHAKVLPVFEQQEKLEQENQRLAALRDWLLPMLMNGQVQVAETQQ
ncbi:MAG: restriction endonuclease subunit S [Thiolinea sp.]